MASLGLCSQIMVFAAGETPAAAGSHSAGLVPIPMG